MLAGAFTLKVIDRTGIVKQNVSAQACLLSYTWRISFLSGPNLIRGPVLLAGAPVHGRFSQ
jgi:hypothetical protein